MNKLSCAQTTKFLGIQCYYFKVAFTHRHAFTVLLCKISGCTTLEHEMLILLTIPGHTCKSIPKISYITMQNEESGGTFVRYRHFHRSRTSSFRQFMVFSAICICIYINCTTFNCMTAITANLFLKTKEDYKSPDVQRVQWQTLHYLIQLHLLNNAITSFSTCTHQK